MAYVFIKLYVVPTLFGPGKWDSYDHLKQRKMVGTVVKILIRLSCAMQIFCFAAPYFSIQKGLFSDFNVRHAHVLLVEHNVITTCQSAGMNIDDAVAMRAWIYGRCALMAVMLWELAFIPEQGTDIWLHHIFVILGIACGGDPMIQGATPEMQPAIDGIAFFLVLGAVGMAPAEVCALMYHLSAPRPWIQARWMGISAALQAITTISCFSIFPALVATFNRHVLGLNVLIAFAVLAFLSVVELRLLMIKWSIMNHAWSKEIQGPDNSKTHGVSNAISEESVAPEKSLVNEP